jgi:hypothetical protein
VIGNTKFIGRHVQLSATGYNKYLLAIKLGDLSRIFYYNEQEDLMLQKYVV